MVYNFFYKKTTSASGIKHEIKQNKNLADELHKPIIRKYSKKKRIVIIQIQYLGLHLPDMELISKCNERVRCFYVLLMF